MTDPQQGDSGDSPKDEGVTPEDVDWLDPFVDGLPIWALLEGEEDDE